MNERNAEQDLSLCEAATKGERLTRVDADYYQGGIYIGVVPKKMGGSDYFETDLFRIEGANNADERLAREAQIILPYWITRCASLQAENEELRRLIRWAAYDFETLDKTIKAYDVAVGDEESRMPAAEAIGICRRLRSILDSLKEGGK